MRPMFRMSASGSAVSSRRSAARPGAIVPRADELLADRGGKRWRGFRPLRITHRRAPDIVAGGARPRRIETRGRIERRPGRDRAVVEPVNRVGAGIEIAEPPPEPAAV